MSGRSADLIDDIIERIAARVVELLPKPVSEPARDPPAYLTTKEAAARMGMSVSFLEGRRARGLEPKWHHIGTAVRYATADIDAFVASRTKGKKK